MTVYVIVMVKKQRGACRNTVPAYSPFKYVTRAIPCGLPVEFHPFIEFYSAFSSLFSIFLPIVRYAIGAATNIEDSVPNTTPRIIANENERMLSPPKMNIVSNTRSVEDEVLMVRASVWLIDTLKVVWKSHFGCSLRFSRMRSKTITLSLIE